MASSPTVLADSPASSSQPASAAAFSVAKFPLVPMLLAVVAGVVAAVLGLGGCLYYLARTGRLPVQRATVQKAEAAVPVTTHNIVLEPLLVNLSDASGSSYLRIAVTLRVADAADQKRAVAKSEESKADKGVEDAIPAVRDTVLSVLGRQTAEGLLSADGKENLKTDLKMALAKHNSDLKLMDVFFTDFLVQR
jgi:flagellar FliL protein